MWSQEPMHDTTVAQSIFYIQSMVLSSMYTHPH